MAEKGWSLDEVQAMSAEPSAGSAALESAQIIGAGAVKGLNESLNPLKVVAGLLRLSQGIMRNSGLENVGSFAKSVEGEQERIISKLEKASEKTQGADIALAMPWFKQIRENLKEFTGFDIADAPRTPEEAAKRIGRPMTGTEKFLSTAAEVAAGAVPIAGGLSGVAKFGGQMAYAGISGLGAATGEQIAGPEGRAVGSLAPLPVASFMARGPTMARAVEDAAVSGRTPTVGQATGSIAMNAVENSLARFGGTGPMLRKAKADAVTMGQGVEGMAARLSPTMEDARVGNVVTTGLSDKETGFVGRFLKGAEALYKNVDKQIPGTTPITMSRTMAVLDDSLAAVKGAEASSGTFQNPVLRTFYTNLLDDITKAKGVALDKSQLTQLTKMNASQVVGTGDLPYEAVSGLRSLIGRKIANAGLVEDIPKGELKRLYGAITQDVGDALVTNNPKAFQAWNAANNFYKKGITKIDDVVEPLVAKGVPEKVIGALEQNARQGETTIRQVMMSLKPEERKVVSAWFVRSLGQASPGAQNATGTVFNIEKFATDWNKLTDGSKKVLFDSVGKRQYREDLDAIVRDAVRVKQGADVLRNPSGTSGATANVATAASAGTALGMGQYDAAGAIAATYIAANLTARMLASPTVVRTLARIGNTPKELAAQQVGQLLKNIEDPDLQADLGVLRDSLK